MMVLWLFVIDFILWSIVASGYIICSVIFCNPNCCILLCLILYFILQIVEKGGSWLSACVCWRLVLSHTKIGFWRIFCGCNKCALAGRNGEWGKKWQILIQLLRHASTINWYWFYDYVFLMASHDYLVAILVFENSYGSVWIEEQLLKCIKRDVWAWLDITTKFSQICSQLLLCCD